MIRNAALAIIILLAAPVVAAADATNPKPTVASSLIVPKVPEILKLNASAPTVCPGSAAGSSILFSSCSGAPGTQVTLSANAQNMSAVNIQYEINGVSQPFPNVGSAGAYTLTVPQLCNGGGNISGSVVISYHYGPIDTSVVSDLNLGSFTVLCAQTAQATASPKPTPTASPKPTPTASPKPTPAPTQVGICPGSAAGSSILFSSCSGAPGTQVTLSANAQNMSAVNIQYEINGVSQPFPNVGSAGAYTLTVPQLCNGGGNISGSVVISYHYGPIDTSVVSDLNLGSFTVLCAQTVPATAIPKP